jgi:argininosuccinate lyase
VGLLGALKGLPSAYNKDLQEDKEAVFDTLDTLALELPLATAAIATLQVNAQRMSAALDDAMLATELADYLVRKGIPFRQSHHLAGQTVKRAETVGVSLQALDLAEYQAIHPAFAADLYDVLDFRQAVAARDVEGGTAPAAVRVQIERARALLAG